MVIAFACIVIFAVKKLSEIGFNPIADDVMEHKELKNAKNNDDLSPETFGVTHV